MTGVIRICCGGLHITRPVCTDGLVMCQLCFRRCSAADLEVDIRGVMWDVCQECAHSQEIPDA